jgi:ribonuclease VapC
MTGSIIVDTSALMSLLFQEPDAESLAVALTVATELRMAAPTWVESAIVVTTRRGDAGYQRFQNSSNIRSC